MSCTCLKSRAQLSPCPPGGAIGQTESKGLFGGLVNIELLVEKRMMPQGYPHPRRQIAEDILLVCNKFTRSPGYRTAGRKCGQGRRCELLHGRAGVEAPDPQRRFRAPAPQYPRPTRRLKSRQDHGTVSRKPVVSGFPYVGFSYCWSSGLDRHPGKRREC